MISGLAERSFYGSGTKPLDDSKCKRKCDIFLSPIIVNGQGKVAPPLPGHRHSWHNVLVPGELKINPSEDATADMYLQLAGYVREVFRVQCGRRYVHAFSICGDIMRCYIFDRGGGSISNAFHIGKNSKTLELFVRILWSYVRMDSTQLGFHPTIERESGEVFLPIKTNLTMPKFVTICGRRFQLIKGLFHQPAIASRGTICWYAEDKETREYCVIKDAWRAPTSVRRGLIQASQGKGRAQSARLSILRRCDGGRHTRRPPRCQKRVDMGV